MPHITLGMHTRHSYYTPPMPCVTDTRAMDLGQAGPTGERTKSGPESFISVEMSCEERLESSPPGSCMAEGGGTEDSLVRETVPWQRPKGPGSTTVRTTAGTAFLRSGKTGGRDAVDSSECGACRYVQSTEKPLGLASAE